MEMKLSQTSRMRFAILFLIFFILENIWITQHSGPVFWISEYSVQHLGYWSSRLSYGLPIVFGVILFIVISIILFFKGFLFFEDEAGRPLNQKPTMAEIMQFWKSTKDILDRNRFPLVMIIIGLESSLLGALKVYEARALGTKTVCSTDAIVANSCSSRWVELPSAVWPGGERVDIDTSSKIISYVQLDPRWPIFLKKEIYKSTEPNDPFTQVNNLLVDGVLEKIDFAHLIFFKTEGITYSPEEIKILHWQETPEHVSTSATIQFFVGFIFAAIGTIYYIRRTKKLKTDF
jgi:hypothetical protein